MGFIANTNTGKYHEFGCKAIDMMLEEHKLEVESGEGWNPCHWCRPGLGDWQSVLSKRAFEEKNGVIICRDSRAQKILTEVGCLHCHAKSGEVVMYPHSGGQQVEGHPGKWWIYLECDKCGYQTALWKAQAKYHRVNVHKAGMEG